MDLKGNAHAVNGDTLTPLLLGELTGMPEALECFMLSSTLGNKSHTIVSLLSH